MSNEKCSYCGESITEDYDVETMPNGKEERFCSAECARDRYREELDKYGD